MADAKFTLQFDGDPAKKGLQDVANETKKTADAGENMGQKVGTASDAIHEAGDEAKAAATKAASLEGELTDVAGGATKADSSLQTFTVSVDAAGKKMDAAADKAEHLARAQAKVAKGGHEAGKGIDTAKDAFGGLDAILTTAGLPGLGSLAGGLERATMGFKDLSAAGGNTTAAFTKILIPLAAIYATYKSLETIFTSTLELVPEIRVQWDAFTESVSGYVEEARKVLNEWGFLNDEAVELKKNTEAANKAFNEQEAALAKAQGQIKPTTDAMKALNDEMERGKEQEQIDLEVQGVGTVEYADAQIKEMQKTLDDLANRPAPTVEIANQNAKDLEEVWKLYEPRIRALNERRKQIKQEEKEAADAQRKADADQKKADEDKAKREKEASDKETERIAKEAEAKKKASDDQTKRDIEAAKKVREARIDELAKVKEVTETKIEGIQQVQQAEQQADAPNKYGEGEAPTAHIDNSQAYAGAVNPFSDIQTDFTGNQNSFATGDSGGSDASARRKTVNEAVAEQLRQLEADFVANLQKKYNLRDDQAGSFDDAVKSIKDTGKNFGLREDIQSFRQQQRDVESYERRNYRQAAAGKDTGEDASTQADRQGELVEAGGRLLEETQRSGNAINQAIGDHVEVTKKTAEAVASNTDQLARHQKDIDGLKQFVLSLAQRAQAMQGAGRGIMPSNATSRARS